MSVSYGAVKKLHADVLRMARTQDKRNLILWLEVRSILFREANVAAAFYLTQQCEHEDARFLVSLFSRPPSSWREVTEIFCKLAQSGDPRGMCWASMSSITPKDDGEEWLLRSAQSGVPWAMSEMACYREFNEEWMEKAAALGEPDALASLARGHWKGENGCPLNRKRARLLWREAAELGDAAHQFEYASVCLETDLLERLKWYRRSAIQGNIAAIRYFIGIVAGQMSLYNQGCSGGALCEIGAAFVSAQLSPSWRHEASMSSNEKSANMAIQLYESWCAKAHRAVLCWVWLAKELGVAKDIRLLIADLIWDQRSAWSARNTDAAK